MAKTGQLSQALHRLLIRVGLLGPEFGGQCILDFPLLTSLNLCTQQFRQRSFLDLAQESHSLDFIKQLLGLPLPGQAQIHRCTEQWVKDIKIDLGPLYRNETLKVAVKEREGKAEALTLQVGPESPVRLPLDANGRTEFEIEGRLFLFRVLDSLSVEVQLDESRLTLAPPPPQKTEHHICIELEGVPQMVKSGGSLVKSSLLEVANQVAPTLIPEHLIGDISTPRVIPSREAHLPLPNMQRYHIDLLLMGVGPVKIKLELGDLKNFSDQQLDILKQLFDYTFYHPELKKIFGSK